MRFNSKELAHFAQTCANFDKEGILCMKERQDGLFKKGESYVERYFKLKGNLLFYFKNKDKSEPLGVFILERCTVELDVKEEVDNSFLIVFEGEECSTYLAATSEDDRDSWIQALHIASYECLKMQLQSLREQLQARTGKDPISLPTEPNASLDFEPACESTNEETVMEITLACRDLPLASTGLPPNPLILIHTITPSQQQLWVHHNHTEIVEKNSNPLFLKTVGFGDRSGIDMNTRVRLTVYHVVERVTGTTSLLGQAIFTLGEVVEAPEMSLTLNLQGPDIKDAGQVVVMAWVNADNMSQLQLLRQSASMTVRQKRTLSVGRHKELLTPDFENFMSRSFRFTTNSEHSVLHVHEVMAESKFTLDVPIQLLKLWIMEEKQRIALLQEMGESATELGAFLKEEADCCMENISSYTQHMSYITAYKGPPFKPSRERDNKDLEFLPINLHLHRMAVRADNSKKTDFYDVITMGACTAHVQKFKNGGLLKMLTQEQQLLDPKGHSSDTKLQRACAVLNKMADLKAAITVHCESLCQAAARGSTPQLQEALARAKAKVHEMTKLGGDSLLQQSADAYFPAKSSSSISDGLDLAASLRDRPVTAANQHPELRAQDGPSRPRAGSSFVKTPTVEPWEVTLLNLEAAVMCLASKVDNLIHGGRRSSHHEKSQQGSPHSTSPSSSSNGVPGSESQKSQSEGTSEAQASSSPAAEAKEPARVPSSHWLAELSPCVDKLKTFVEIVASRASLFFTFRALLEYKDNIKMMHSIKYRRDVVNASGISALITGIRVKLLTCSKDPEFFHQLATVGILIEFESLLSCHGDEMSFLEDLAVAVEDLSNVRFQFTEQFGDDRDPVIELDRHFKDGQFADLNRHKLVVKLPLEEEVFASLPESLRQGKKIPVTPVLFNIGINEQATVAERFGSTALQEGINVESVGKVLQYYEDIVGHCGNAAAEQNSNLGALGRLTKQLRAQVATRKNKNVDVLQLAAEICRKLRGIRVTCCKSGKDRTAMAVTLEEVRVLQQEHDLASHVFWQALDCLRSVGCRRENTLKNAGVRKYAFNAMQLLSFPKLYKAPSGTYGNVQN